MASRTPILRPVFRLFNITLLLLFSSFLQAEEPLLPKSPLSIYLTWVTDPATTMVVQWISENPEKNPSIHYRKNASEDPWQTTNAVTRPFPEDQPYFVHMAYLSGLSPDTSYRFTVEGYPDEHLFSTMPATLTSPLSFIVGGDINLSNVALFDETNREAVRQDPAFVVIGGDLACAASQNIAKKEDCNRWITWFTHWYQDMQTPEGRIIPLLVTIGNHEVKGGYGKTPAQAPFFYRLFASPGEQGYTVLRFDSYLSLYLLDSGHTHPVGGEQAQWLAQQMSHDEDVLHRIAVYHIPAYPDVRPYRNPYSSSIRRNFVPVFDTYHLHIAFENHDHAYKRTIPLIGDREDPYGVVYIGNGSWGTKPRVPKTASRTTYLKKTIQARQFSIVTISPQEREVTALSYDGIEIDRFSQPVDTVAAQKRLQEERLNWEKRMSR